MMVVIWGGGGVSKTLILFFHIFTLHFYMLPKKWRGHLLQNYMFLARKRDVIEVVSPALAFPPFLDATCLEDKLLLKLYFVSIW